jgi:hypothetical protein
MAAVVPSNGAEIARMGATAATLRDVDSRYGVAMSPYGAIEPGITGAKGRKTDVLTKVRRDPERDRIRHCRNGRTPHFRHDCSGRRASSKQRDKAIVAHGPFPAAAIEG